jgi:hypothetical protein
MIARYNAGQIPPGQPPVEPKQPPQGGPQRPTWLPEKFKSPEDMAKAYAELESRLGQPKPPEPPQTPPQKTEGQQQAPQAGQQPDWNALSQEIVDSGSLSPESRAKVLSMGIPEAIVDGYVQGQVAQVKAFTSSLHEAAGGEQQYDTLREWAASNMSEPEKAALQAMVNQGIDGGRMAIQTMKARFEAAVGRNADFSVGGKPPGGFTAGYESVEQMKADMRDPRYSRDPAFRAMVEQKVANAAF